MKSPNQHLWPENETPCIWMEAGLVDYKLCEYNLDCENCPFDAVMRNNAATTRIETNSKTTGQLIHEKYWDQLLQTYTSAHIDQNAYYGNGYWYFEPISATKVIVGIDQFAAKLFPKLKDIILSEKRSIRKGQTVCWLVSELGTIRLASPISGRVLKSNNSFQNDLEPKSSPVWLYVIEKQNLQRFIQKLEQGNKAKAILEKRQKTIIEKIMDNRPLQLSSSNTLPDGGELVGSLEQLLGEKYYFNLVSELFTVKY